MNWNLVFTIVLALTPIHLLLIWVGRTVEQRLDLVEDHLSRKRDL